MNAKKDPIDMADDLLSSISYMRTLLGAAEDKVKLYFSGGPQLGPYRELLAQHAAETGALLDLAGRFLDKMDCQADAVTDLLYAIEPVPTAS